MVVFGPSGPAISRSAVVHDPFDEEAFEEILPKAEGLRLLLNGIDLPLVNELAFDLFGSLYKYFVKLRSPAEITPEAQGNRNLLGRALDRREHEKLRAFTRLKPAETALATELVLDALLDEIARGPQTPDEPTGPQAPEDASSESAKRVTTQRLREVLKNAGEDLQSVTELVAAWSAGPGQETHLPAELKLRLMRDVIRNPRLRMIALLFGRYRRLGLRPVEVVWFGDAADPLRIVSMWPADDPSTRLEKLLDVATYFLGGGTDFVKPLSHVLEAIETGHHTGNDLLFVTDGLCPIPEEFVRRFREAKARYDLRMTYVLIGEEALALREISDTIHRLDEALEAGEALTAHFASAFLERGHEPLHAVRGPLRPGRGTPLLFDHFLPAEDQDSTNP